MKKIQHFVLFLHLYNPNIMFNTMAFLPTLFLIFSVYACALPEAEIPEINWQEYEYQEPIRIAYGDDSLQFGDLRMPEVEGKAPLIMVIHGGCWLSSYDLTLMDSMSHELTAEGFATWNIEYRRTEDLGGGWPGTFLDIAEALKYLYVLAEQYPIDLDKIAVTGHSAGGHLALFLGTQNKLKPESELKSGGLPNIKGVVSLAGITDLKTYYQTSGCGSNVKNLVDGLFEEQSDRYLEGSPITHLPLGIKQILINGLADNIVPVSHIQPYFDAAQDLGEDIQLIAIPGAGHFEVIMPGSTAWPYMLDAYREILGL